MSNYENKYRLFSVGAIGTFMATLDGSIINVALPSIASDLNCSIDKIAWTAISYSLTLLSLLLIFGVWAGKKGYSFSYSFGYIVFMIGSTICALSNSFTLLIFGRIIHAIGTAMFAAIGPAMVTDVFPPNERGKGIGMMVMMVSAGFMVGPPLGGFLLSTFPWQSIFVINIPIGVVGLFMTLKFFKGIGIHESDKKQHILSALSMSVSLVLLTFCLTMLKKGDLYNLNFLLLLLGTIVFLGLFLYFESKPKTAMIGLSIFRNRQFVSSVGAMLFMFTSLAGVLILIPFYLERIKNFSPQHVGYFLIVLPIMMFIFAPLSGRLSDKIGNKFLSILGMSIQISGLYLLSKLNIDSSSLFIVSCLLILGIGNGIFNTPNSSTFMGSVSSDLRSIASSILATTRNIGMSVGVALSTALFALFQTQSTGDSREIFISSYQSVIYVSLGIAFISLIFTIIIKNQKITKD